MEELRVVVELFDSVRIGSVCYCRLNLWMTFFVHRPSCSMRADIRTGTEQTGSNKNNNNNNFSALRPR